MVEQREFEDLRKVAQEFLAYYDHFNPRWRNGLDMAHLGQMVSKEVNDFTPTQEWLWKFQRKTDRQFIAPIVAAIVTGDDFQTPDRWRQTPGMLRSVLSISAKYDQGRWNGMDEDIAAGKPIVPGEGSKMINTYIANLRQTGKPSLPDIASQLGTRK